MNNKFNKKYASNELKSIRLLLVLAGLIYLITSLLFVISYYYNPPLQYDQVTGLTVRRADYTTAIILMIMYYISIILIAVYQFRYLYNTKAIDFFHSLPIKRTTLMLTKTIVGFCTMSILFAIFFTITDVIINRDFLQTINFLLLTILSGALLYTFILFVINITNNLVFLATTTISLIAMPYFITIGICDLINTFTIFHVNESNISLKYSNFFNIFTIDNNINRQYGMYNYNSPIQILLVSAITLLLLAMSIKLYNMRKCDDTSHFIIFKAIRIIYICVLIFTISIMLITLFKGQSTILIYLGTLFCLFAVSVILDIITNFDNGKQKQELKYSLIPTVALLLLLNVSINNFYGIFDTVPIDNIQSITINGDYSNRDSNINNFIDPVNFETIQTVENDLIQQYYDKSVSYEQRISSNFYILTYTMDNGNIISRKYWLNPLDNIDNANTIVSIPEYKQNVINILANDEISSVNIDVFPFIDSIEVQEYNSYYRQAKNKNYYEGTTIIDSDDSPSNDALLDALLLDITNDKDFQIAGYTHPTLGNIYVGISTTKTEVFNGSTTNRVTSYDRISIPLKPYYTNTLQAIHYNNSGYSILVLNDFSDNVIAPLENTRYFIPRKSSSNSLHTTAELYSILQYYYDINSDTINNNMISPLTTLDKLAEDFNKCNLPADYTILSTDEELQQFNDSYTFNFNNLHVSLVLNTNSTNYRAFLINNETGAVDLSSECLITTQPDLY